MFPVARSLAVLAAVACVGCGPSIKVTRVTDDMQIATGNPWNLPMTQFTLTITRHVTKCGTDIEGKVEVLASAGTALDPEQRYVLESEGLWSTSDITSNLSANGVSTGLNAQSASSVGTIASNVVTTFAKVAVLLGGLNVQPLCAKNVATAVNELYPAAGPGLRDQVDADTAALAEASAKVELLTAQTAADKQNKPLKANLVKALQDQAAAKKKLGESQAKLTQNLKVVSDTQVVSWPRKSNQFRTENAFDLSRDVLARWTGRPRNTDDEKKQFEELYARQKSQFAVHLALLQPKTDGTWQVPPVLPAIDVKRGVPVRIAQPARLLICQETACDTKIEASGIKNPKVAQSDQVVLQMGQTYIVPLTGGTFGSQSGAITLDTNGRPTTIQVVQKVSAAEAATATAKDAATQLAALPAEVRAAELARLKFQTDEANAKSALATAQANLAVADQTSSLAAQTALIKAQTDLAIAKLNAGLPLETASLTAQTALINAQVNLATAQANAAIIDKTSVLAAQTTLLNAETALINAAVALAKARQTQATLP